MARETPWRKQQKINPRNIVVPGIAMRQSVGSGSHTAQPPAIDGQIQIIRAIAPFDFDEGHNPAAPRDNIHLATRIAHATIQNAPAFKAKKPCAETFRSSTLPFTGGAVHLGFNSMARA